jgi:hypothetical protein
VEGDTPAHFFEALLKELRLESQIEVRNFGGNSQLGTFLKALALDAGFRQVTSLGIVRDAEDDPTAAQQSVQSAIQAARLPSGVGVQWAILPDGKSPGQIETLCMRSVRDDPVYECTVRFFESLKNKHIQVARGGRCCKHFARVFMAGKDCPELFVGQGAYKKVWPFCHPAFNELKDFLSGL